jgi:hypothetical protein
MNTFWAELCKEYVYHAFVGEEAAPEIGVSKESSSKKDIVAAVGCNSIEDGVRIGFCPHEAARRTKLGDESSDRECAATKVATGREKSDCYDSISSVCGNIIDACCVVATRPDMRSITQVFRQEHRTISLACERTAT